MTAFAEGKHTLSVGFRLSRVGFRCRVIRVVRVRDKIKLYLILHHHQNLNPSLIHKTKVNLKLLSKSWLGVGEQALCDNQKKQV